MAEQFKTLTVEVPQEDMKVFKEQPVLRGTHVMGMLRDAGIPVTGILWPSNVEHGTLFMRVTKDVLAFKWEGHVEVAKKQEVQDEPLY